MATIRPLPKLAAMFLTEGHRIPVELVASPALDASAGEAHELAAADHPLAGWECPLDASRRLGALGAWGDVKTRPPE